MDALTIPSVAELAQRAGTSAAGRVLIGVTGPPGAGKSTLSDALVDTLGAQAVLVPMDGYHLADEELARLGLSDRKGAPETFDRAGFAAVLARLRAADETVYLPRFRRELEAAVAGSIAVSVDHRVLVVEGNYLLLWPEVHAHLDQTWYVDPPMDARLAALVERHVRFGRTESEAREWVMRSDEANAAQVASGRQEADLIVTWA